MTYREKLKLYKQGKLPEAERETVAQDIERHEAIGEYLLDEIDLPELEQASETEERGAVQENEASRMTAQINSSIRKAFVKTGVIVGAAVLAIVLFAVFALPRIVDCFYYDPAKPVGEAGVNGIQSEQLSLDLAVYTELFVPSGYRDQARVERRGFGTYDVTLGSFSGQPTVVGTIERNKLTLFTPDPLRMPTANAFDHNSVGVESSICGPAASSFVDMNAQTLVAYCTFDHVMTYEEFVKWVSDNGIDSCWGAICVKTRPNTYAFDYETIDLVGANLGMRLNASCSHLTFDQEKYPELRLFSLSETTGEEQNRIPSEENAKRHVASMLRYMEDHPIFFEQMGIFVENHRYEQMAKRVEEQGLFFYGCCFTGTPNEILRTAEAADGHVGWLYTKPVA